MVFQIDYLPLPHRFYAFAIGFFFAIALSACVLASDQAQAEARLVTDQRAVTSGLLPPGATAQQPFWLYSTFGQAIGLSNIVIGPKPADGIPEVIIGGTSTTYDVPNDFWQVIKYDPQTANYEQLFVSQIYPASIQRIGLGNVRGDSTLQIVVMLSNGNIHLYDFATKAELGYITGPNGLSGMCLADLDGDGISELIVTSQAGLYVFNGNGNLLWQVPGAGGTDVVVGQMDNDPALEIATTSGKVVDATTHAVKWTYNGGFGFQLALAPEPGTNYQQLIGAQRSYVNGYDVARQVQQWSIQIDYGVGAIRVADVDNDGTAELLVGDNQWGWIHVYDVATQTEKWKIADPDDGANNIAVGDVDGDGDLDLLWGGPVSFFVASTTGTPQIKWRNPDLRGPFLGPIIGDLDGDGQLELVACSTRSSDYFPDTHILVFDLATQKLRAISGPVMTDGAHDLKLRDLNGDGRMEIILAGNFINNGDIEIYSFDSSSNTFTQIWTNATRPQGAPFQFVDVADVDGNGTAKIVGLAVDSSPFDLIRGTYIYAYDYPSGNEVWHSASLGDTASGFVVDDLDGNGTKEIAAQATAGSLYTFDSSTGQLDSLAQSTRYVYLSSRVAPLGLVAVEGNGLAHFLNYGSNGYTESFAVALASGSVDGINILANGDLWTSSRNAVSLRRPPSYSTVEYVSPTLGYGGHTVAEAVVGGQNCVFSSTQQALVGFVIENAPSPSPTPTPTSTPTPTPAPNPPIVRLSVSPTSIGKGGTAAFMISTSANATQPLAVSYSMSGTAGNGIDYTLNGPAVIAAGESSTTVTLTVTTSKTKGKEKATMTLGAGGGYNLPGGKNGKSGKPPKATVTILNK